MYLSQQDILTGLSAIIVIAVVLFCIDWAVKMKWLNKLLGRKLLHFTAITTCAWAIAHFENRVFLACTFLLFFFILLGVIKNGWMQVNDYKTYGIAFFPLAFAVLLFIPLFSNFIIVYAVLILGISDALAGIGGEYFGRQKITFLFEKKSWVGFAVFYFSALLIALFYFNDLSLHGMLLCLLLSLLTAITELFSYRGSDNFTVPVFTAAWALLLLHNDSHQLQSLLLAALLFAAFTTVAQYKKWLTVSGAVAACWVALLLYASGGYKAFIAPGIFLVSGSLLSKLNPTQKEKDGRNAIQVFANGIIGIIFMLCYAASQQTIYLITAIVSFSISMADSTSSELGVFFKGNTFDILTFKKTAIGLSGGISLQGTIAGLLGAMLISGAASYSYHFSIPVFIVITLAGFAGMLADSILGSWLQIKYKRANGSVSDDPEDDAQKIKGFNWCTNDTVNILSNILITLLFFGIFRQIS
jgi:uncharacterized protein (TIGR00297 family)